MASICQEFFVDEIFTMFCNRRVSIYIHFTFVRVSTKFEYNCLPMQPYKHLKILITTAEL